MIRKDLSLSKNALNFGAMVGVVMSVIQMIAYSMNFADSNILSWILMLILILSVSWSVRKYRDMNGGYIDFGQAIGFGLLLSFGGSLVYAVANYLYIKYLDPTFIQVIIEQTELAYYEAELPQEEIDFNIKLFRRGLTPATFAIGICLMYTFLGFISSLIISFFVRNPKPMFEE